MSIGGSIRRGGGSTVVDIAQFRDGGPASRERPVLRYCGAAFDRRREMQRIIDRAIVAHTGIDMASNIVHAVRLCDRCAVMTTTTIIIVVVRNNVCTSNARAAVIDMMSLHIVAIICGGMIITASVFIGFRADPFIILGDRNGALCRAEMAVVLRRGLGKQSVAAPRRIQCILVAQKVKAASSRHSVRILMVMVMMTVQRGSRGRVRRRMWPC